MNKEPEVIRETSSQLKRRRMLQFDSQVVDSAFCNEDISTVFLKSNVRGEYILHLFDIFILSYIC